MQGTVNIVLSSLIVWSMTHTSNSAIINNVSECSHGHLWLIMKQNHQYQKNANLTVYGPDITHYSSKPENTSQSRKESVEEDVWSQHIQTQSPGMSLSISSITAITANTVVCL